MLSVREHVGLVLRLKDEGELQSRVARRYHVLTRALEARRWYLDLRALRPELERGIVDEGLLARPTARADGELEAARRRLLAIGATRLAEWGELSATTPGELLRVLRGLSLERGAGALRQDEYFLSAGWALCWGGRRGAALLALATLTAALTVPALAAVAALLFVGFAATRSGTFTLTTERLVFEPLLGAARAVRPATLLDGDIGRGDGVIRVGDLALGEVGSSRELVPLVRCLRRRRSRDVVEPRIRLRGPSDRSLCVAVFEGVLLEAGEAIDGLGILTSGALSFFPGSAGRRVLLGALGPGPFGESLPRVRKDELDALLAHARHAGAGVVLERRAAGISLAGPFTFCVADDERRVHLDLRTTGAPAPRLSQLFRAWQARHLRSAT